MSDPFQNVDEAGSEFAEATAKTMEIRQSEPIMERIVESYLEKLEFNANGLTVEIGCGAGTITQRIIKRAGNGSVMAFDPSANYIEIARKNSKKLPNLNFAVSDGDFISIEDGKADNVIMHTVLSHVVDPSRLVKEAYRLLRCNGKLVICDADFSKATLASSQDDPLSFASSYFVKTHVTDPYLIRKVKPLASKFDFVVEHFENTGRVVNGNGMRMWVEVAAKGLLDNENISPAFAEALLAEYDFRVEREQLYGFLPFFTFILRKI